MNKHKTKIFIFSLLLVMHFSCIFANNVSEKEFGSLFDQTGKLIETAVKGAAVAGVMAAGTASFGLYKSYQWARYGKGAKQNIGIGILAGTGLAANYGFFCISKK